MDQFMKYSASFQLDRWREKVKTIAGNIFSPPYLPSRFIWFFLLTNLTNLAIAFMNHSPNYWSDDPLKIGVAQDNFLNEAILTDWFLNLAAYLPFALFCLAVFNYRWSLIGWLTAEVFQFLAISSWLSGCSYGRWSLVVGKLCDSYDEGVYWLIVAVLIGVLVTTYLHPGADSIPHKQIKKGIPRISVLLGVAWSLVLIFGMISSARKPTSGWIPLELTVSPPPLNHSVHAYDTKHNKLILFGGITKNVDGRWIYKNETWEWDGNQWQDVSPLPQDSPRSRISASMAYDENRDVIVLYGGEGSGNSLCDTWEWNGERWIGLCPPSCPGARFGHEMFYDPIRKKVILYGGYDAKTFFNDAWEWDGYTWTRIEIEGDSPSASWYALAYNPEENYALGLLSGFPGGTWTFKDNRWTRVPSTREPSNRGGMRLVYDPNRSIFVTFGGSSATRPLNDTWFFDGENWSLFTDTKLQPPIRLNMVMWYDNVRKHVMLFGGKNAGVVFNDTWELIPPEN